MPEELRRPIRKHIRDIEPYVPIEPADVLSQRVDISPDRLIKLDGNENPYGCSERARRALANYQYYHLYPDPEQRGLRRALAEYVGVSSEYIVVGSGSDELIDLILRLFLEPGERVVNCPPTFGMYSFSTAVCGGVVVNVPRKEDFSLDMHAVKRVLTEDTKVIFIASPNNPSGNVTSENEIRELLQTGVIVVVDEAYFEFSDITVARLVTQYPNLVVLRTFSKWAGLAGLRVGYGIFPVDIAKDIMKIKQPYNVNSAAQIAALESLKDMAYLRGVIQAIVAERQRLIKELSQFDWLKVYPSQANFVLCRLLDREAKQVHNELQRRGIFVRYFDVPTLRDCLRISVGKPEHTDALIAALKDVC